VGAPGWKTPGPRAAPAVVYYPQKHTHRFGCCVRKLVYPRDVQYSRGGGGAPGLGTPGPRELPGAAGLCLGPHEPQLRRNQTVHLHLPRTGSRTAAIVLAVRSFAQRLALPLALALAPAPAPALALALALGSRHWRCQLHPSPPAAHAGTGALWHLRWKPCCHRAASCIHLHLPRMGSRAAAGLAPAPALALALALPAGTGACARASTGTCAGTCASSHARTCLQLRLAGAVTCIRTRTLWRCRLWACAPGAPLRRRGGCARDRGITRGCLIRSLDTSSRSAIQLHQMVPSHCRALASPANAPALGGACSPRTTSTCSALISATSTPALRGTWSPRPSTCSAPVSAANAQEAVPSLSAVLKLALSAPSPSSPASAPAPLSRPQPQMQTLPKHLPQPLPLNVPERYLPSQYSCTRSQY